MLLEFTCPCCLFPPSTPQIYMVWHLSSRSPPVNCAVVTEYNICVYPYIHTQEYNAAHSHLLLLSLGSAFAQTELASDSQLLTAQCWQLCRFLHLFCAWHSEDTWQVCWTWDYPLLEQKVSVQRKRQRNRWTSWSSSVWPETLEFLYKNWSSWADQSGVKMVHHQWKWTKVLIQLGTGRGV